MMILMGKKKMMIGMPVKKTIAGIQTLQNLIYLKVKPKNLLVLKRKALLLKKMILN